MPTTAATPRDLTGPTEPDADVGPVGQLHPPGLDGVDPLSYRVFQAFMRTLHLHRQLMARTLVEDGSHPGQAVCLRVLAAHDGMSQRDLGRALHLTPPTVTTMLQRMERAGIVERRPDETDQRLTRVRLTAEGRKLEERLRGIFARYISQALDSMTQDDRRELERLLSLLADNTARALAAAGAGEAPVSAAVSGPAPLPASGEAPRSVAARGRG
ncbi:MAG: transcriptional regulator, MarR family [Chloroflexi bacterium]|nr:transcriptional regulator, MarR family [Chloroflexota bacterium]